MQNQPTVLVLRSNRFSLFECLKYTKTLSHNSLRNLIKEIDTTTFQFVDGILISRNFELLNGFKIIAFNALGISIESPSL